LHAGIEALSSGDGRYEFVMSPASYRDRPIVPDDQLARCELVIQEASPWTKYRCLTEAEESKLPSTCQTLLVPTMHFNSLWPLMIADPRNVPEPHLPWGRLPFAMGDRLALKIRETVPNSDEWLSAYFAADIGSVVNIRRNHHIEVSDMFAREQGCDVQIASYVVANFRRRRLFSMHHHPTAEPLAFVLIQLLSKPATQRVLGRSPASAMDEALDWMEGRLVEIEREIGEEAPIHPAVAKFFELSWYSESDEYRWIHDAYTFREWVDFYLHYEPPKQESGVPE
jgi:hypothetical protein